MRKIFKSKKIWLMFFAFLCALLVLCVKPNLFSHSSLSVSEQSDLLQDQEDGPSPPQDLLYHKRPLEAYCLGGEMSQANAKVSLSVCTQRAKEVLVSLSPPKAVNGWWGYNDEYKSGTDYIYYKYLGALSAGDHLIFKMNGNYTGTGRFSSIEVLHREGETITLSLVDGGDRSFGGVDEVSFEKGVLRYIKALTPLALFQLWQTFSKTPQESGIDVSSLADCAVCQIGSASYEIPADELQKTPQEKHIVSFSLTRTLSPDVSSAVEPRTLQDCFDQVLEEYENRGMTEFSWEDLDGFFQEVLAFYKKQSYSPSRSSKLVRRAKKVVHKKKLDFAVFPNTECPHFSDC